MKKETISNLPAGVTQEMIDELKEQGKNPNLAELFDSEGTPLNESIVVIKPSANTINQFEKFIDKDPLKAKRILIKNTVVGEASSRIGSMPGDSSVFNAAFDAAANMIPYGKSQLKKL